MTTLRPRPEIISHGTSRLVIQGGRPLSGTVAIGGAKNAALPIMAACLLTDEWCIVSNVPDIEDIQSMSGAMRSLGAEVNFLGPHEVAIRASHLTSCRTPVELAQRMRASFLLMGPLLTRMGRAEAPHPGGCAIGVRPVNVDVRGFEDMGATITYEDGHYIAEAKSLTGTHLYLDYPSHTGTENLMMAACLADGTTVVKHASMEPEVADLARFLSRMGAKIRGAGSPFITIEGVDSLHGANFHVMPDRLAAGTYEAAGVISRGSVAVSHVIPDHLDAVTHKLREAGAAIRVEPDRISAGWSSPLGAVEIQAIAYPGFPTDLQTAFGALLTQAEGTSIIHERVFENRFLYVSELRKMGADIEIEGQTARIRGATRLRGAEIRATDIRSGAALVLAALAADGTTVIEDAYHLDRGFDSLVPTLSSLGASIRRE